MNVRVNKYVLIAVLCLFDVANIGCFPWSAIDRRLIGNFYLIAPDVDEQLCLSECDSPCSGLYGTIIGNTVFAVGFNNQYIIAKQHPCTDEYKVNKNVVKYYIFHAYHKGSYESNLIGPLNLTEFEEKRKELNIENIDFTIVYKELE